jgi:hypothetical protein
VAARVRQRDINHQPVRRTRVSRAGCQIFSPRIGGALQDLEPGRDYSYLDEAARHIVSLLQRSALCDLLILQCCDAA